MTTKGKREVNFVCDGGRFHQEPTAFCDVKKGGSLVNNWKPSAADKSVEYFAVTQRVHKKERAVLND